MPHAVAGPGDRARFHRISSVVCPSQGGERGPERSTHRGRTRRVHEQVRSGVFLNQARVEFGDFSSCVSGRSLRCLQRSGRRFLLCVLGPLVGLVSQVTGEPEKSLIMYEGPIRTGAPRIRQAIEASVPSRAKAGAGESRGIHRQVRVCSWEQLPSERDPPPRPFCVVQGEVNVFLKPAAS